MSETGNSDKTAGVSPPKATLHLKRPVEQGTVRQSFSHGRSKVVVVEKKRRVLTPGEVAPREAAAPISLSPKPAAAVTIVAPRGPTTAVPPPPPPKTGV